MQERPQNFKAGADREATLVAPRFDAEEARRAHPVVPLAEARTRPQFVSAHTSPRRRPRPSWLTALLAVGLVAVVAAGGALATKVLRRPQASPAAQAEDSPAPVRAADAPQQQAEVAATPAPREEARAGRASRAAAARGRGREEVSEIHAPPAATRGEGKDDAEDEPRHGRDKGREKRRAPEEGDAEKEVRKALKRAKEKAPRLVDVLTGP